jgi:cytochrome c oxidase subunit 3/cytochrome o ubiquinol oxidase subunit 3
VHSPSEIEGKTSAAVNVDAWLSSPAKVGMLTFLLTEAAFFSTLLVAYVVFLGQSVRSDPSPAEVFHWPLVLVSTACLLSSSVTVHFAARAWHLGRRTKFVLLWSITILLGVAFLFGTAREWAELIGTYGLTISRNMFGTTYFTLVGFHAAHVTAGLIIMAILLFMVFRGQLEQGSAAVEIVSWYWHFVDAVWLAVFTLVYVIGR